MQWGIFALVSALAIGAATTIGSGSRSPAAAGVPAASVLAKTHPDTVPDSAGPIAATSTASSAPTAASPVSTGSPHDSAQASALASDGIPATALQAYEDAAQHELTIDPSCGLSWPLLAGIGRVESDHGRFAGAVLHTDGVSTPHIIGIQLNGHGTTRILDTDHGRLDGDTVYDRAVGAMQFIPSTWARWGVDGNGDGIVDPFNIFDDAAAAAAYLCAAGGDLRTLAGQTRAVRAYNDSNSYIALVLQLEAVYARGVPGLTVPILPAGSTLPTQRPSVPPVNPGPPLGLPGSPTKKATVPPAGSTSQSSASASPSCPTRSTAAPSTPAPSTPASSTPATSTPASSSPATSTPATGTTAPGSSGRPCPASGTTTSGSSPVASSDTARSDNGIDGASSSPQGAADDSTAPGSGGSAGASAPLG